MHAASAATTAVASNALETRALEHTENTIDIPTPSAAVDHRKRRGAAPCNLEAMATSTGLKESEIPFADESPAQLFGSRSGLDLDAAKPEWIRARPVHATLAAHGTPVARLLCEPTHVAALVAERISDNIHVVSEQLTERPARPCQFLQRLIARNARERTVVDGIRSKIDTIGLQLSSSRRAEEET